MKSSTNLLAAFSLSLIASFLPVTGAHAQDGAATFRKYCFVCHATDPGTNKLGPSLSGVVGRKAGSVADFNYSAAMKNSGLTWDEATLDKYLTEPQKVVPGTKMAFLGVRNADERKALIAYLATLKD
jgi:cytochrome c2